MMLVYLSISAPNESASALTGGHYALFAGADGPSQ